MQPQLRTAPLGRRWAVLLFPLIVVLATSLACGGFQVRVTPTATTEAASAPAEATAPPAPTAEPTEAPTIAPTQPAEMTPTPAPTATPAPRQARVLATGGLNVREAASAGAKQAGRLGANAVVTVLEGPTQADNYDWYRIDNGSGVAGWVAAGPADDPWLRLEEAVSAAPTPAREGMKLVDRAIATGDRVQVTTESNQLLTVRIDAGRNARAVAKVPRGTLFTVKGGPLQLDNFTWWELDSDTVKGWAAEGDGTTRWLTPVE